MIRLSWLIDLKASALADWEMRLVADLPDAAGFWLRFGIVLTVVVIVISLAQVWKVVLSRYDIQSGKFTTHYIVAFIIAISVMALVFHFVGPLIFPGA